MLHGSKLSYQNREATLKVIWKKRHEPVLVACACPHFTWILWGDRPGMTYRRMSLGLSTPWAHLAYHNLWSVLWNVMLSSCVHSSMFPWMWMDHYNNWRCSRVFVSETRCRPILFTRFGLQSGFFRCSSNCIFGWTFQIWPPWFYDRRVDVVVDWCGIHLFYFWGECRIHGIDLLKISYHKLHYWVFKHVFWGMVRCMIFSGGSEIFMTTGGSLGPDPMGPASRMFIGTVGGVSPSMGF